MVSQCSPLLSSLRNTFSVCFYILNPGQVCRRPQRQRWAVDLDVRDVLPSLYYCNTLTRYTSNVSSGQLVDAAFAVTLSADSFFVAVGSWGDDKNVNPQLHVFRGRGGDGSVLASMTTAGSVVDLLLYHYEAPRGSALYIVMAALDQHENYGVLGGNVTLLSLDV